MYVYCVCRTFLGVMRHFRNRQSSEDTFIYNFSHADIATGVLRFALRLAVSCLGGGSSFVAQQATNRTMSLITTGSQGPVVPWQLNLVSEPLLLGKCRTT